MENKDWEQIKSKFELGQFMQAEVKFHTPFGVFLNINEPSVKGLIKIPDFLDDGAMSESMYPEIGAIVDAVVIGYNESNCREVYLSVKPSVLHKALVPADSGSAAPKFGSAKGLIKVADDFDDPIEGFEEYSSD